MKKIFHIARIGFYILMLFVFFVIGLYFASFIDAGKGQGLAGGAIVVGYGVLFGGVAFVSSFFIANLLEVKKIKIANWILLVSLLALWGYTYFQFSKRDKKQEERNAPYQNKNTTPTETEDAIDLSTAMLYKDEITVEEKIQSTQITTSEKLGLGFFTPNIYENPTLYFYGGVNHEKGLIDHIPQDSLVFKQTETEWTTTYGPPYLYPEAMKLDYGIVFFKVLGVSRDFLKVELNRQTGQIGYIDKSQGAYKSWPEMLLSFNTIERLDANSQPARIKGLENASEVNVTFNFLKPLIVEGDWVYGILTDNNYKEVGKGWIRWKKDGELLIGYNLLS